MNNQEFFNTAWEKVRAQGRRSVRINADGFTHCCYRGEEGARCAMGFFLSDNLAAEFEGRAIGAIFREEKMPEELKGVSIRLMAQVQTAHDTSDGPFFVRSFELKMMEIASEFGLTVPEAV